MKLKAAPQRSDREIAAEVGVSQPMVSDLRKRMEASGEVKESITTVGKDGVMQPRQKKYGTTADKTRLCVKRLATGI